MVYGEQQPDALQCLACGHRFMPRRAEVVQRRCGSCGSTATVSEGDLALASLALKPWAYLMSGSVPPLPLPHELAAFPAALAAYARVMGSASREDGQRRAVRLMLQRAGFSGDQVAELVQRWEGAPGPGGCVMPPPSPDAFPCFSLTRPAVRVVARLRGLTDQPTGWR